MAWILYKRNLTFYSWNSITAIIVLCSPNKPLQNLLQSFDTYVTEGQRIHYNFVKPHLSLGGQTPTLAAGIKGNDKWLSMIKNAKKNGGKI